MPDNDDPELFETIKTQLIHGPYRVINPDSLCLQDKKWIKRYPKAYLRETPTDNDGYPIYRRRKPKYEGKSTTLTEERKLPWLINKLLCKGRH